MQISKIGAIKLVRTITGWELGKSKQWVNSNEEDILNKICTLVVLYKNSKEVNDLENENARLKSRNEVLTYRVANLCAIKNAISHLVDED